MLPDSQYTESMIPIICVRVDFFLRTRHHQTFDAVALTHAQMQANYHARCAILIYGQTQSSSRDTGDRDRFDTFDPLEFCALPKRRRAVRCPEEVFRSYLLPLTNTRQCCELRRLAGRAE